MHVTVKVYLNEGHDHFFGFNSEFCEPALRMAAAFTFDMGESEHPLSVLNEVYQQLNVGGDMVPATPWTTTYRAEGNRSLSVGDVVIIGETAWSCESVGWEIVPTAKLTAAIEAFNLYGAYRD